MLGINTDDRRPVVTVQEPTPGSSGASTKSESSLDKGLWMKGKAGEDGEGGSRKETIDEQVERASSRETDGLVSSSHI
jgi:hypothetical protein